MQELSAARGANHNAQLAHLKNTEKNNRTLMWTSLVSLTIISGSYDQKSPIIIVSMHWLRSEGNRLHQSVCCGHFQLASY